MKYDLAWLKRAYDNGIKPQFLFFADAPASPAESTGQEMLAQWYPSGFSVGDEQYLHAAQWMMVQKARLFGDDQAASELLALKDDKAIMDRGRRIKGFDQTRWDEHKFSIVVQGNLHKFSQHGLLQKYISGTHPRVLTEANPDDRVWGIGLRESAPGATNPHRWEGLNLLGFALMEVRDILGGISEVMLSLV